jgi:hypothetical protein
MTSMPRLLAAIVFSPFVIVPAILVAMCMINLADLIRIDYLDARALSELRRAFMESFAIAAFGIGIAWVANLVIGLPAYVLLRICDLAKPVPCGLLGATLGLLGGYALVPEPKFYVLVMASGGSVAMAFCGLANGGQHESIMDEPGIWF